MFKSSDETGKDIEQAKKARQAPEKGKPTGTTASEKPGNKKAAPAAETAALQDELAKAKEQNVRLLADFDNFRRRTIRESSETYQRASEAIYTELLPVIDNFERALEQAPAEGDGFGDGVRMLHAQLVSILEKAGVAAIDALGADFNPDEHEAIAYQPSPEAAEGKVIYQTQKGYRMGAKVIRPAMVIVSSGPAVQDQAAAKPAETPEEKK